MAETLFVSHPTSLLVVNEGLRTLGYGRGGHGCDHDGMYRLETKGLPRNLPGIFHDKLCFHG